MATPSFNELVLFTQQDFIRARYPRSYAVSLLMEFPDLVPEEVWKRFEEIFGGRPNMNSPRGVADLIETWAGMEDENLYDVYTKFADAYLTSQGLLNR